MTANPVPAEVCRLPLELRTLDSARMWTSVP